MLEAVYLDYEIPIWRYFYEEKTQIPKEFIYQNKKYKNGITIIQFSCFVNNKTFIKNKNFLRNLNKIPNPILCAPNQETFELLKKIFPKNHVIIANHNSFINEHFYNIYPSPKKYDMVINSSFLKLKQVHLGKKINNTAHIGYQCMGKIQYIPDYGFRINFKNNSMDMKDWRWLNHQEILDIYKSSKIGGIFSEKEGACFSSSEYLLCGLPVLSVNCQGGREYFYNNYNSVLCKSSEKSVYQGYLKLIDRYKKGTHNPHKIRKRHIKIMEKDRNTLTNKVIEIFKTLIKIPPEFNDLKNKLKYYHSNIGLGSHYNIEKTQHPIFYEECIKQADRRILATEILKN